MTIRLVGVEFHVGGRAGGQTDGETDKQMARHNEANVCLSHFFERTWKQKQPS